MLACAALGALSGGGAVGVGADDAGGAGGAPLGAAIDRVFLLEGGTQTAARLPAARARLGALLQRQQIPADAGALRALPDDALCRIALLAAVGGASVEWQRDAATDALLLDEHGRMLPAFVPNQVESDVMLCIICALLAVIGVYFVAPDGGASSASSSR